MLQPGTESDLGRLEALRSLEIIESGPESAFDRLANMARRIFGVPIALISMMGEDGHWAKACLGCDSSDEHFEAAFTQTFLRAEPIFVEDASQDERFRYSSLVIGEPHVRCFASVPLVTGEVIVMGSLCLMGPEPREFSENDQHILRDLAIEVISQLDLSSATQTLVEETEMRLAAEVRYHSMIDSALDCVISINEEGRLTGWNAQAERTFGWTAEEVIGRTIAETVIPPEFTEAHHAGFKAYVAGGPAKILNQRIEIPARTKAGQDLPVELTVTEVYTDRGREFCAFVRDLSDIKAAQLAARRMETRYQRMAANVPGIVFQLERSPRRKMTFSYVSEGSREILGLEPADILADGGVLFNSVHPEDRASLRAHFKFSLKNAQHIDWEGRFRNSTGSLHWMKLASRCEQHEDGSLHWDGVLVDITPIKEAEASIREINSNLEQQVEQRTHELKASRVEIIERLGRAAEYRDRDTKWHIIRMSRYSEALALQMGMTEREADQLRLASQLHDIGKIAVPDRILLKEGPLDEDEWELMKQHTTLGTALLADGKSKVLQLAEKVAASHHERWDGTGYPHRLGGESIPLEGRIAAVADVFDALSSHRAYKKAWTLEKTIDEVIGRSGSHFDPAVVKAFQDCLPTLLQIREELLDQEEKALSLAAESAA